MRPFYWGYVKLMVIAVIPIIFSDKKMTGGSINLAKIYT